MHALCSCALLRLLPSLLLKLPLAVLRWQPGWWLHGQQGSADHISQLGAALQKLMQLLLWAAAVCATRWWGLLLALLMLLAAWLP